MADEMYKEELSMPPKFEVHEYEGVYIHDGCEIDDFPSFKCRDDDVWVCSYPRSGTTLTQQITYLIMTLDFEKGRTVDLDDRFPYADLKDERFPKYRGLGFLDSLPRDEPRLIKSHMQYFLLPNDLTSGKGRIIYIIRNPQASVVSFYKVLQYLNNDPAPTLRIYIERFLTEKDILGFPWGQHVRRYWEHRNDTNVLFLLFEKLIKDRRGTIKTIAEFLGRDLTEKQIDMVLEDTTLQNMKSNNSCNFQYFEDKYQTDKSEGAFINKGEISGWKKEMPEDLIKQMDEMIERELGNTDIQYE